MYEAYSSKFGVVNLSQNLKVSNSANMVYIADAQSKITMMW